MAKGPYPRGAEAARVRRQNGAAAPPAWQTRGPGHRAPTASPPIASSTAVLPARAADAAASADDADSGLQARHLDRPAARDQRLKTKDQRRLTPLVFVFDGDGK